ncbi:type 4a pilus biogenesis protein PilO [Candidatus Kuenenbacteria bacterium]|nr:type 4a pilus biogenesis protein PilO [Candidatus Kuenenbacteria bacterium]
MNQFQQKIAIIFVQNFKIFLVLTILIIFGLGYFLFVNQFYSELQEKRKELDNFSQNVLTIKKKQLDTLKTFKKEYQKLEGLEVQKLLVILPLKKNIPDLFKQIEDITQKSGLTLLSLDITEGGVVDILNANENKTAKNETKKEISSAENKNLKSLNISIEIGGVDYFTLKVFLNNLEKNIRLIDVISFDFGSSEKSQKMNLRTYYLE